MYKWIRHKLWLVGTASSFLIFGLGALAMSIFLFPILIVMGNSSRANFRCLWWVRASYRLFCWWMQKVTPLNLIEVDGLEHLPKDRPYLLVANHPSYIDFVILTALLPVSCCVVNKSLIQNRFMRGVILKAGYILNSLEDGFLSSSKSIVDASIPIQIFPEGSRSPLGGLRPFLRGAAQIALRFDLEIYPVEITLNQPFLSKGVKWYQIPHEPVNFKFKIHPQFQFDKSSLSKLPMPLQVRELSSQLYQQFLKLGK